MPRLKFTATGVQQTTAAQERIRRGLQDQSAEVEKVTRSTAELGRITNRVNKDNETSQQRLKRLLDEVNDAHNNGRLSLEQRDKAQKRLTQEFESSTNQFSKFKQVQEESFGSRALNKIGQIALAYGGVQKAIQLVTDELRAQQDFVNRQGIAQRTLSQARAALDENLLGVSDQQRVDIRGRLEGIAGVGVDRALVVSAGAEAVSATGGDVGRAISATQFATQFFRTRPEQIPLQAGAIADVMELLGTDDPAAAFGFLKSVGGLGRVVDPQAQADTIPQAVAGSLAFGSTVSGAGALTATLTNVGKDRRGRRAANIAPNIAEQLSRFDFGIGDAADAVSNARGVTIESGALGQRQVDAITSAEANLARRQGLKDVSGEDLVGLSTSGRIRLLQQNPDLAREFLDQGAFGRFGGVLTQILTDPAGPSAQKLRSFESQVPVDQSALAAQARGQLAGQLTDPLRGRDVLRRGLVDAIGGDALALTSQQFLSEEELQAISSARIAAGETQTGINFQRTRGASLFGFDATRVTLEDEIRNIKNSIGFSTLVGDEATSSKLEELLDQLVRLQAEANQKQDRTLDAIQAGGLQGINQ